MNRGGRSGPGHVARRMVDEPNWCVDVDPTLAACSLGEHQASTMPASERRAILLSRARERAQVVLAQPEERAPEQQRRAVALIGVSLAIHAVGFGLLAWFGDGIETRAGRRGREQFSSERVVVPIDVPARELEPEPELAPEPDPAPTSARPRPSPHRHASSSKPASADASEPSSYALPGFELSSEAALPAGTAVGDEGSGDGEDHGDLGPPSAAPDVQAKPRGSVVEPDYPPELERRGIEGDVVVLVWLDEHGHVLVAEVVESSGYEAFDHNAEMAAQRQAWTPAMQDGEPISSKRRYRIRFRLPGQ
jgi:TonB family protein